jgi:Ni/Fe-hydrogenase subunit HybB-like protein
MLLFIQSFRKGSIFRARVAAVITIVGIVLNRLNVSIIAFRWDSAMHYTPSWMEIVVSFAIIFIEIWIFRWFISRMPVLRESPSWAKNKH